MTTAISVRGLGKRYRLGEHLGETMLREAIARLFRRPARAPDASRELWALRDVSFDVQQGEVVGLVGRNGAGKSTLLKVLSRITYPTMGSIAVAGRLASLLEVGTGFHDELSGRENIYLNGSILGMRRREIDARLDDIVAFSGVERFLDTPIKRYSSGMRLRLGFAVAAHLDPEILLVDEVLAVGDAEFQRKCLDAMSELRSGGRTVLFVSHNMAAVENLCSRALWIDGGTVRQDGKATDVIRAYLATFGSGGGTRIDLKDRDNRRGDGRIRFTGIEVLDTDGNPLPLVRAGDALKLRLAFDVGERIEEPHFGVEIHTDLGTRVTEMSTWGCGHEIPVLEPGAGTLDLDITMLNLMPGRYHVSLWAERPGPVHFDVLDRCAVIDVETSNYYGSGRGIDGKLGVVFLPCRWTSGTPATRAT
ncbi:MAG: ABC transporter ATP-binding protein [Planctomycetes bacterium]|nr:ABC transporter ATP-binding protein [Planctomycetota bacterium]